jgi:hypothetical protein
MIVVEDVEFMRIGIGDLPLSLSDSVKPSNSVQYQKPINVVLTLGVTHVITCVFFIFASNKFA